MATRTILSPGPEIRERNLSLIAQLNAGTNIFITGYTSQGPTDEVLKITTKDELEAVYGVPTNSVERYFYHGVKELLTSPASIYTYRLPYGEASGTGFGSNYSALVYPVNFVTSSSVSATSAISTNLNQTSGTYVLGHPTHVTLSENEYRQAQEGSLFTWSSTAVPATALSSTANLGGAGLIILNKAQTTINTKFEGFYVGIADNTNINPASNFDSILGAKTVSVSSNYITSYTDIPIGTLQFSLSSNYLTGPKNSVSQVLENLTDYNIDGRDDDDLLNVGVFKLRKSLYATEAYKLDYVLDGAIVGSIDSYRQRLNPTGGPQVSFFLEGADSSDRNVEILVNPWLSNRYGNTAVGSDGIPTKKVRVLTHSLSGASSTITGIHANHYSTLATNLGFADNIYAVGAYSNSTISTKILGSIPSKVERALETVKNDEIYDIDVVVEAGLGTVYTVTQTDSLSYYDDTTIFNGVSALRTSNELASLGTDVRANYSTIFNLFIGIN